MAKQKIEIEIDVPDGYEATGEYRRVKHGDFYLEPEGAIRSSHGFVTNRLILRRVKQYREPVLPADVGKKVEFANDKECTVWVVGHLGGWVWNTHPWRNEGGLTFIHCRIEKEST